MQLDSTHGDQYNDWTTSAQALAKTIEDAFFGTVISET